jgi:protoheme IX farnesyltransferase
MSISSVAVERRGLRLLARGRDYVELTKPKIAVLVLITVAVAAFVATWGQLDPIVLLHALVGTTFVAASASAFNHWLEVERDALMQRTADRPLPGGRLSGTEVVLFAIVTILLGAAYLLYFVNWQAAGWGMLTWLTYVWIYTPLKVLSPINTFVGAIAGALPMMIGWSAVGGEMDVRAGAMFLIVFLWQFPHFMAIAWLYRHQYERAGMQMLPVVDPSGLRAGVQAVLAASALLPTSLLPALNMPGVTWYLALALVLGLAQLVCAVSFCVHRNEVSARWLLRASLVYLPALMILLVLVQIV